MKDLRTLIERIHRSPFQVAVVVTGGGSWALAHLLSVPGASKTLIEGVIPYSEKALEAFLGFYPRRFVSSETAVALAQKAYVRALSLRPNDKTPVLGVSCTATLVTDRPKKGNHRAFLAVHSGRETTVVFIRLVKGARDRLGEEEVVGDLLVRLLARACGLCALESPLLLPGEALDFSWGCPPNPNEEGPER